MNETLKIFIDNLFIGIEESDEVIKIKNNLIMSTNEKYNDLINEGLKENEAIGQIIKEFGNIEEILDEYNITTNKQNDNRKILDVNEVKRQYKEYHKNSIIIGVATFIILFVIGLVATLEDIKSFSFDTGIIFLLGSMPSIALYIYAGIKLYQEANERGESFKVENKGLEFINKQKEKLKNKFVIGTVLRVSLCILGVFMFVIGSKNIVDIFSEASIFYVIGFTLIGMAVLMFIHFGIMKGYIDLLLKNNSKSKKQIEKETISDKIIGALFLFGTIVFLLLGLVWNLWQHAWIIYPIIGLIAAIISIFTEKE